VTHGYDHEFDNTTDDIFFVVKCKNCGFIYLNPRPDMAEFATIYPKNYYCYSDSSHEVLDKGNHIFKLKQKLIGEMGFPKRIRRLLNSYPLKDEVNVIDIGCGNGSALDIFKKIGGKQVKTYGIDMSDSAARIAAKKGHIVYKGDFSEVDLPGSMFDIIYSSNVIEHVADPSVFMEKAAHILKPNGLFLCETPNIASWDAEFFKKSGHWGGYHFPRHWTFFTPVIIQELGNKFGLTAVEIKYFPVPIFWIWTFHSIIFRVTKNKRIADTLFPLLENKNNFFFSFILKTNFTLWDYVILALTGKTTLMCVFFRKKASGKAPNSISTIKT
jgi:2-polyprenyl-3-methyl-5-hydroxy-6-metoxy-1,4-benzoquinol methylase